MSEKELLKKSGFYTSFILFGISLLWFLFSIQLSFGGYIGGPQAGIDIGINSRSTSRENLQPGSSGVYIIRLGIENVTGLGTATGYMSGTDTYYPRIEWTPTLGTLNFIGTGSYNVALQTNGVNVPSFGSVTGKLDAIGGTGTTNILTDTTLAGQGTITASFGVNELVISPAELSMVDGAIISLNTVTGSVTSHVHTGSDGTTQVSHASLTNKGTQTHTQIDDFIASKASASGLASLDTDSLVTQNPASGTSTPGANKTVMSDGTSKILDGWLSNNVTKMGTPTTDNISEGSTNKYYTDAKVNTVISSSSITSPQGSPKITFTSPASGQFLRITDSSGNVENATSSASVDFTAVTGSATASQLPLISGLLGSATSSQLPVILELLGTTTTIGTTSPSGRWYTLQIIPPANDPTMDLYFNNLGTSTFVDFGLYGRPITNGGNVVATTTAVVAGVACGYFDGSANGYLNVGSTTAYFSATGDFTLEGYSRPTAITGLYQALLGNQPSGGGNSDWVTQILPTTGIFNFYNGASHASTGTFTAGVTTHWAVVRSGGTTTMYLGGVSKGSFADTSTYNVTQTVRMGMDMSGSSIFTGYHDNFKIFNYAKYTSNFTPSLLDSDVAINSTQFIRAGTITPSLLIVDNGTYTTNTYFLADVTTSIFGLGTTTDVTGTITAYAGWFDGAVRATAFNVASTEKIKDNIKPIKIKPDLLDAEGMAKNSYIANSKIAWIVENGGSYTTVINETGTGSVIVVDTAQMNTDYNNHIEFQWASDLNQDTYISNVQKTYEKGFWQMFDSVKPRSWNPKDKPSLTRKGFVVEDMPDVVKGDDKQSIDPMALIAYLTVVQQTLKADTIFALSTLKELLTTGTVTQQKIDYISDRLDVLQP